jgi:hypothetical protein
MLDELLESPGPAAAPLPASVTAAVFAAKAKPLSETVRPLPLDLPTQVDDPEFLRALTTARNLSPPFVAALQRLY